MTISLRRTFRSSKVPPVDATFWLLKILTTAMGEATSDFLVHRFNPELAVFAGAVVFVVALWWQLGTPRYLVLPYWFTLVMVSVFGTMCADSLHVGLGVPYAASASLFGVLLAAVFLTWSRTQGTLSIHQIKSTQRELLYFAAVTMTFAFGTALGDLSASVWGWGYLRSGVIFALVFCVPGVYFASTRQHAVAAFWISYVLTRPMGASFADYLGVAKSRGGLNWGPGNVSLVFSTLIAIVIVILARRERVARPTVPRTARARRVGNAHD